MKKNLFSNLTMVCVLCTLLLRLPVSAQQPSDPFVWDDAAKVFGLSRFCAEVKYNFTFYEELTFDWDSLCYSFLPAVLATETPWEYYLEMQRLCTFLGDGHTEVHEPHLLTGDEWVRPAPFQTRFLDDRVFIDEIYSSHLMEQGITRKTEILRVNGMPALEYGRVCRMPYISASTPQNRLSRTYEYFEFTKDRSDRPLQLELRDPEGNVFSVDIHRGGTRWDLRRAPYTYYTTEDHIGVLRISTFGSNGMDREFDALYKDILQTDALVIDLRNNGGGNSGYSDHILRHLTEVPVRKGNWSSPMYVPAFASWNWEQKRYQKEGEILQPVDKPIYTKPVVVLVNGATYSSAEDFCVGFRGMERGQIIGLPTAGSTGNPVIVPLIPGVIDAGICSKADLAPDGTVFVGIGILPDIEVRENAVDYLNGKDPVMEKAVECLSHAK